MSPKEQGTAPWYNCPGTVICTVLQVKDLFAHSEVTDRLHIRAGIHTLSVGMVLCEKSKETVTRWCFTEGHLLLAVSKTQPLCSGSQLYLSTWGNTYPVDGSLMSYHFSKPRLASSTELLELGFGKELKCEHEMGPWGSERTFLSASNSVSNETSAVYSS